MISLVRRTTNRVPLDLNAGEHRYKVEDGGIVPAASQPMTLRGSLRDYLEPISARLSPP